MKLSIIICTYNVGERLKKTLDSVLAQNAADYEVVIVDGVSSDGTIGMIKEYEEKFEGKLRWISEKDTGIYNAMNKGVQLANGEFINVIGAGDWFPQGSFNAFFHVIGKQENSDIDAVYGKTRVWSGDLKESEVIKTSPNELHIKTMQHNSIFYRKNLHDKFGFYDESYKISSDYNFCLKAFHVEKVKAIFVDQVFVNFVKDGISSKKKYLCLWENFQAKKHNGIPTNLWKEFFPQLKNKIFRLCRK